MQIDLCRFDIGVSHIDRHQKWQSYSELNRDCSFRKRESYSLDHRTKDGSVLSIELHARICVVYCYTYSVVGIEPTTSPFKNMVNYKIGARIP